HTGPRMVKPPIVHTAGLLRRLNAGVTTDAWAWIGSLTGQQLFYPPNVAGWDDSRWLDTATFRGRWIAVGEILDKRKLDPSKVKEAVDAPTTLKRALGFWNNPELTPATHRQLLRFTQRALKDAQSDKWKQVQYPVLAENALRQLIAMSPDLQTA
ncbi:MAG TPA: DUF1800 family protein, partial [Gaiellaceae bacterium]|nr:DUF1800 family protein [Gaiellaceae bacterium]